MYNLASIKKEKKRYFLTVATRVALLLFLLLHCVLVI